MKCFRYGWNIKIPLAAAFFTVLACNGVGTEVLFDDSPHNASYIFIWGNLFFVSLFLFLLFGSSPVCIDEDKIYHVLFGITWRTMEWQSIKLIKTFELPDLTTGGKVRSFLFNRSMGGGVFFLPGGPIQFTDKINNLGELLDIINVYIKKYNLQIDSLDTKAKKWKAPISHLDHL